jgi:hypothetical protein
MTYIKYIAIIAVAFGMNSCPKKNIRFKPIDRISIDAAFSSPSLIALSMNGMYNAAQIGQYNSTNPNGGRGYVWVQRSYNRGDNRGEDVVNLQVSINLPIKLRSRYSKQYLLLVDGYRLINR